MGGVSYLVRAVCKQVASLGILEADVGADNILIAVAGGRLNDADAGGEDARLFRVDVPMGGLVARVRGQGRDGVDVHLGGDEEDALDFVRRHGWGGGGVLVGGGVSGGGCGYGGGE